MGSARGQGGGAVREHVEYGIGSVDIKFLAYDTCSAIANYPVLLRMVIFTGQGIVMKYENGNGDEHGALIVLSFFFFLFLVCGLLSFGTPPPTCSRTHIDAFFVTPDIRMHHRTSML